MHVALENHRKAYTSLSVDPNTEQRTRKQLKEHLYHVDPMLPQTSSVACQLTLGIVPVAHNTLTLSYHIVVSKMNLNFNHHINQKNFFENAIFQDINF